MSLVANGFPDQSLGVSPDLTCRWVAAWNPVVFNYIRQDCQVSGITDSSGNARINLTTAPSVRPVAGDKVYVFVDGYYDGTYTVLFSPTTSSIVINTNSIASVVIGGYVNLLTTRPNYYVDFAVLDQDDVIQSVVRYTPNSKGYLSINIQGILQSFLNNDNDYDYETGGQQINTNAYFRFSVKTKEVWTGSANAYVDEGNNWFAVNGAFQVGHPYNGNYIEYLINNVQKTGKFLSPFRVPTVYPNFPITLSFLWDSVALPNALEIATFTNYTSNPNQLPPDNDLTGNTALNIVGKGKFNTFVFPLGGISGVDNRLSVWVWLQESAAHNRVSEQRKVKIKAIDKQACNTVFLRWLAPDGSYGCYLFEGNYRESLQVELEGTFKQTFNRIDTLKGYSKVLKKNAFKKFQVGMSGLDQNDADGIETLLYSPQVYRLTPNATTGFYDEVEVIVEPGTFQIKQAKQNVFDVEFSIVFPEIFNQGA